MEVPCTTKLSFLAQCCFQENNSFYSKLSSFYLPKMAILYLRGIFHHITYTLYFESLNTKFDIFLFFFQEIPYSVFLLVRDIPVLLHSVYDLPCFKIGQAKATLQVGYTHLPVFLCYPYCLFVIRHPFTTAGVLAPLSTNRQSLSGIFLFSI